MSLISFLAVGLLAGIIARALMPGPQPMGILATLLLGVAGSFVGGLLSTFIHGGAWLAYRPGGLVWSALGAILLLAVAAAGRRRQA